MTPYDAPAWIILVWLFVLGSVLGSFLNVCIYRIPRHDRLWDQLRGISNPPSHCPRCRTPIARADNVPILGWLKLGGRCRYCGQPISLRYPLVELFNGLLFVIVYWFEIPSGWRAPLHDSSVFAALGPMGIVGSAWLSPVAMLHWRYAYHVVLLEALVVASLIDLDERIIPDATTLPAMALGVFGGFAIGQVYLVPVWFQDSSLVIELQRMLPAWLGPLLSGPRVPLWIASHPHLHGLAVSVAGIIVGGGLIWAVRLIGFWTLKQEAMGFGDVILMAMIGSFLGWQPTVIVFFLAALCASVVAVPIWLFRRDGETPFGPYLSLAVLIVMLAFKPIWNAAERMFDLGPLLPVIALVLGGALALCLQFVQLVKRALGIPLYDDEWIEQWTSGDQLVHYAGQHVDSQQGRWRVDEWQGKSAGRGTTYLDHWSRGSASQPGTSRFGVLNGRNNAR